MCQNVVEKTNSDAQRKQKDRSFFENRRKKDYTRFRVCVEIPVIQHRRNEMTNSSVAFTFTTF